jgi:hypothetical protein
LSPNPYFPRFVAPYQFGLAFAISMDENFSELPAFMHFLTDLSVPLMFFFAA